MSQVELQERLGKAVKPAIGGLIVVGLSLAILFVNEGRAVNSQQTFEETTIAFVEAPNGTVHPSNDGKLVHVVDVATTDAVLKDEFFGVSENVIRLNRRVEMLQWKELEGSADGRSSDRGAETTYSYVKVWSSEWINSSRFHEAESHQNPTDLPFEQLTLRASDVSVGEFRLPKAFVEQITQTEPLEVDLANVQKEWAEGLRPYSSDGSTNDGFYWSRHADSDGSQIGDVRILFSVTRPTPVSVMAQQTRDTFTSFTANDGRTINEFAIDTLAPDQMIDIASAPTTTWSWVLRAVGIMMTFVGITSVVRSLSTLANDIPSIGAVVDMGAGLVTVIISSSASLTTISLAWLFYRPLIGVPMLLVGIGLIALLMIKLVPPTSNESIEAAQFVDRPFGGSDQTRQTENESIGV